MMPIFTFYVTVYHQAKHQEQTLGNRKGLALAALRLINRGLV